MKTKTIIIIGIIAAMLIIAGTIAIVLSIENTYSGEARDYALAAHQIGNGWRLTEERETQKTYGGIISSWVVEAEKNGVEIQVGVLVFESVERCKEVLADTRTEAESIFTISDYRDGYSGSAFGSSLVTNRKGNVMFQVIGKISLTNAKTISDKQYANIG